MKFTRRDRRDGRILLGVNVASAIASAIFGVIVVPDGASPLVSAGVGVVTSVLIATPIAFIELRGARRGFLGRLRRLPLAVFFAIKVLSYFAVIIFGLTAVRLIFEPLLHHPFTFISLFEGSLAFAIAMSIAGNLAFEMGSLLGFGTLKNLLTGRYVQPKREQRVFLLIDMKDSTGLAERLGAVRFHELLNLFFGDIADAALECQAEIHKYVGDEAILTWEGDAALADGACLSCPFVAQDAIASHSERYRRRFGAVPDFRAALHCGEIVAGEIGDVRREIAYVGDTLNVAARLLDWSRHLERSVLVSTDLLERARLPAGIIVEPLPTLAVRGREAPLGVAALSRSQEATAP
jgi:adenylate cyclase